MNICLDTGVVIAFLRDEPRAVGKIQSVQSTTLLLVTPVTLCELYQGVYLSSNTSYELIKLNQFLDTVEIIDFTKEICRAFGEESVRLQRSGTMVDDADLMIAAIAKEHDCILVTRNKKHFAHIRGLKVEEW